MTTPWENLLIYVNNGTRRDVLPKARLVAFEIADACTAAGHRVIRIIGATNSYQHNNLLCLDLVGDAAMQKWVRAYLLKHEDRLQIEYMINSGQMWRAYAKGKLKDNRGKGYGDFAAKAWSPYGPQTGTLQPRYIGTDNPHTDHVHLTLYPGVYVAPTEPPQPAPAPEPSGKSVLLKNLRRGLDNADVITLQKALITHGQRIPAGATGFYGDQTHAAVLGFQKSLGWVPQDGIVGPVTAARLGLTVRT